jgi:hypothetical protein
LEGKVAKLKGYRIQLCVPPNYRLVGGKLVNQDGRSCAFLGKRILDVGAELFLSGLNLY